ncbi:hypothetical protein GCM10007863_46010 [Dyella mobilis]|nr:hypothetical protein GCM10007863_46010 [Dyella mobilis]
MVIWNTIRVENLKLLTILTLICELVCVQRVKKEAIPYSFSMQVAAKYLSI